MSSKSSITSAPIAARDTAGVGRDTSASTTDGRPSYHFSFLSASAATYDDLIAYLLKLINDVYTVAERGIFVQEYARINTQELTAYINAGELVIASTSGSSPLQPPSNIVGCIRVVSWTPSSGGFGMLIASPQGRGAGLGRQLVEFAEDHCKSQGATRMQIELLLPTSFVHEVKSWLQPWYERMGYKVTRIEDFHTSYPMLAIHLMTDTEFRIFEKDV